MTLTNTEKIFVIQVSCGQNISLVHLTDIRSNCMKKVRLQKDLDDEYQITQNLDVTLLALNQRLSK